MNESTIRTYNSITLMWHYTTTWDTNFTKPLIINYTIK
jgi:hypothetical protein